MDATFTDINGNKKNFLYQYDKGQYLVIKDFNYSIAPKVQFQIKSIEPALSVQSTVNNSTLRVSIPDNILTFGEDIIAYIYIEDNEYGNVIETVSISVIPRKKPSNYTYTSETFTRTVNGTTISDGVGFADTFLLKTEEDVVGYFVSIDDEQIVSKATSLDNVYGVAISTPGFASNCNDEKLDSSTGNLLPQYVYVCSFGFATVIDNGTCVIGDLCVPTVDGTATPSNGIIGYKVVSRIDDNHIFIFVNPSMDIISSSEKELSDHINNKNNPHKVTKLQLGLENVDNTSDENKPISTKTQEALNKKADIENDVLKLSQLPSHSSTHAIDGSDALSCSDIGAAKKEHIHTIDDIESLQEALDIRPTMIDGKISKEVLPDNISSNIVVETIEDRDALIPVEGLLVHVKDASGDESVSSAYADYIYDGEVWVKTGGFTPSGESGSGVDTIEWANITNKPSSFTPKLHASTHASDGTDPITPISIGAVAQEEFLLLQSQVKALAELVQGFENADIKSY